MAGRWATPSRSPIAPAIDARKIARWLAWAAALMAGATVLGIGGWRLCYHQSDITRLLATGFLVVATPAVITLVALTEPGWRRLLNLVVLALPVALTLYLWLLVGTVADRCPLYDFV